MNYRSSVLAFTLIEVLIATVLGVVVVGAAVTLVPKAAQRSATQTQETTAQVRTTKLTQTLEQEFRRGRFAGFTHADSAALKAVFTTGNASTLPQQDDLYAQRTLTIPGLSAPVGSELLLVSRTGLAKLVKVTDAPATDRFTLDCATGLPSNTEVKVFPAQSVQLRLAGGTLTRTVGSTSSALGSAQGLSFNYVYQNDAGTLTRSNTGTATSGAGRLVGFLPTAKASGDIDRATLIDLPPTGYSRVLACNENAAATLNDARLNVTIEGLPTGVEPNITLSGPDASVQNQRPQSSRTFQGVKAGTYQMQASDVQVGENIYRATIKGSPATLHNTWGETYMLAKYSIVKGRITVRVEGLPTPPPGEGTVRFSGPEEQSIPARTGTPDLRLTPGTYTVTADPVGPYEPVISTSNLTVTSSTDTEVVVKYAIPTGTVRVQVSGLPTPPPASGYVRLSGPETDKAAAQTGTADLTLRQGTYAITADQIGEYEPSLSTSSVSVSKGSSTTVTVNYALPKGPLSIQVQGLPAGTSVPVSVSGPQSTTINTPSGSTATASLKQGTYTITAPEMTVSGTKYLPTPASASVNLGKTGTTHTVTYASGNPGMPTVPVPPGPGTPEAGVAVISMGELGSSGNPVKLMVYKKTNSGYQLLGNAFLLRNTMYNVPTDIETYYGFVAENLLTGEPVTNCQIDQSTGETINCKTTVTGEVFEKTLNYADSVTLNRGELKLYNLKPNLVNRLNVRYGNYTAECRDPDGNWISCPY